MSSAPKWMSWIRGRQNSGYDKLLLMGGYWPIPFDVYLLKYPEGSFIPPHRDPVDGKRHFRINIVLKEAVGGDFRCENAIFASRRINIFRSDVSLHEVTKIERGCRWVLSIGWLLKEK